MSKSTETTNDIPMDFFAFLHPPMRVARLVIYHREVKVFEVGSESRLQSIVLVMNDGRMYALLTYESGKQIVNLDNADRYSFWEATDD